MYQQNKVPLNEDQLSKLNMVLEKRPKRSDTTKRVLVKVQSVFNFWPIKGFLEKIINPVSEYHDMIQRDVDAGYALKCQVNFGEDHWFLEHEHGLAVILKSGQKTVFIDLCSCGDDERYHDFYEKDKLFYEQWHWIHFPNMHAIEVIHSSILHGIRDFKVTGKAFKPRFIEDQFGNNYCDALDIYVDLMEYLISCANEYEAQNDSRNVKDEGHILDLPYEKVDSFIRNSIERVKAAKN